MDIVEYIRGMLDSFEADPADSDYQRGYQAALQDVLRDLEQPGVFNNFAQIFYLTIKRDGEWERSIQNTDATYLRGRGAEWQRLGTCEDWQVNAYPVGK